MTLIASSTAPEADAQVALATAFAPQSVAIAGVSPRTTGWGGGQMFLRGIRKLDRVPNVYCLNPRGGELDDGTPLYKSLSEIPGAVDSLISAVPASAILGLVDDAIAKGVKVIHLFTAGFGETGSAERADLETEVLRKLREAGIRLIGPNCMGVHSTRGGVSWMEDGATTPGRVGMLSQSGMNASEVVGEGVRRGITFSNIASFGNASDLNESHFLEFLANDSDTDIVLAYLEGIRNGRRFLDVGEADVSVGQAAGRAQRRADRGRLSRCLVPHRVARRIRADLERRAKAGTLHSGQQHRGTARHGRHHRTHAQRCPVRVAPCWAAAEASPSSPPTSATATTSPSPGSPRQTQRVLREFTPVAGTSIRNPLDAGFMFEGDKIETALTAVADDPSIDWLMVHTGADSGGPGSRRDNFAERMANDLADVAPKLSKPLAVVIRQPRTNTGFERGLDLQRRLNERGIACYQSIEACARAVRRYLDWQSR